MRNECNESRSRKQNGVVPVATMTYNARGERSAATRGDASSLYTYDGVSRLASQQDDVAGAGADVTTTFPVYNPAEQIVGMTRDNDRYSYGGYAPDTVGYAVNVATGAAKALWTTDNVGNATTRMLWSQMHYYPSITIPPGRVPGSTSKWGKAQ